ncbi:hypothetical protein [Thermococcus peptonophilus]
MEQPSTPPPLEAMPAYLGGAVLVRTSTIPRIPRVPIIVVPRLLARTSPR